MILKSFTCRIEKRTKLYRDRSHVFRETVCLIPATAALCRDSQTLGNVSRLRCELCIHLASLKSPLATFNVTKKWSAVIKTNRKEILQRSCYQSDAANLLNAPLSYIRSIFTATCLWPLKEQAIAKFSLFLKCNVSTK